MRTYRSGAVANLAMQLERGPTRLCLRQLHQIEFLLSVIETDKSYPFDFVRHTLTGFRPVGPTAKSNGDGEDLLDGSGLRADLATLAEHLSETADVPVDACTDAVYTVSDLAARFDVSTKTIFRWRQRGLIGWRLRFADNRIRIAFPERCIRRFVAEHSSLVVRGSSFSQLTLQERSRIIARAQELATEGDKSVNAVSRQLAGETGRAVETIRLVLKHYDEAHPGAGVFNRRPAEADDSRLPVWEAYLDGASLESLARRFDRPIAWVYRTITQMRARDLKSRKVEFVHSPDFELPDGDELILNDPRLNAAVTQDRPARMPADLAPYLQNLFRVPLLTPQREFALFRKYNYLKFKANARREQIDPETAKAVDLDRLEALLDQANQVKNEITQANLRLVVSIAKRHVRSNLDLFELISDGNISLMKAVEKFDFTRGFKFSTYGSWAIMKNFARSIPDQNTHADRYQTGREEYLETVPGMLPEEQEDETLPIMRATLDRMLDVLDDREQRIIRKHFGLEEYGQTMTLEEIGRQLGVSKERIRQIESRAMARLRTEFAVDVQNLLG